MKTRQGFVSNSSTTSFCIMGEWMNAPEGMDDFWGLMEEAGLECHRPDYNDQYAVGLPIDSMGEDETKSQFRKRVADVIFKATGESVDPDIIEEAYYS